MKHHVDACAVAGHGLVYRVVHHLVHQVVKPSRPRRTDVHARPFADGLKALQNGDCPRVIAGCIGGGVKRLVGRICHSTPRRGEGFFGCV